MAAVVDGYPAIDAKEIDLGEVYGHTGLRLPPEEKLEPVGEEVKPDRYRPEERNADKEEDQSCDTYGYVEDDENCGDVHPNGDGGQEENRCAYKGKEGALH